MNSSASFIPATSNPNDMSQPLYGATMGQAVTRFFKRYAQFSGRSSRSEYWWLTLALFIASVVYGIILGIFSAGAYDANTGTYSGGVIFVGVIGVIVMLALLVPSIALTVRRLHDVNLSGWLYLLVLIPSVGSLIIFIFTLLGSKPEGARFDS